MDRINIIIKTTNNCNLRCKYCYNGDSQFSKEYLKLESVRRLFKILSADFREISVVWHGGEPLSCGIDYFRKVVEIQEELSDNQGNKVVFTNSVQTNGTLIDEEWIEFFKKHKFKVGISFDGINNDAYRQMTEKVLASMRLMKSKGMGVSCLAVVADDDYDIVGNYKYFASMGVPVEFSYMFMEGGAKELAPLSADSFIKKYKELADYWFTDKNGVGVRLIETYVAMSLGNYFRICNHASCHGKYLSVWPDGKIYNCARYSMSKYPFGDIDSIESYSDIFESEGFKELLKGSIERRSKCKEECEYFAECAGGCADCAISEGSLDAPPKFSCYVFKNIYPYIRQKVQEFRACNVPLSEINPAFGKTVMRCMAVSDNKPENEVADKFI